jgi:hypothetical protein
MRLVLRLECVVYRHAAEAYVYWLVFLICKSAQTWRGLANEFGVVREFLGTGHVKFFLYVLLHISYFTESTVLVSFYLNFWRPCCTSFQCSKSF